jgi:serine/threonine protein kinase
MAEYYSLVMNCIKRVQDKVQGRPGTTKIQLNGRQCEYVAQELLKLSQSLQISKGAHNFDSGIQRTVLVHLHAAVKQAQLFVDRCCCENASWLAVAMELADTKKEVIAILLGLHQWKFVLDMAICASAGGSQSAQLQLWETGEEGYQRLSKNHSKMQYAIRDAARQDQEELLNKIAGSVAVEEDQLGDDYIRGVYLRSWLNPAEGDLKSVEDRLKAHKIVSVLGSGASGMVVKVKWLGQDLALKTLKGIDRTEATVLGQLQHPNIVRLFHYWEEHTQDGPRSCIIMELMPRDLQVHIRNALRKLSGLPAKSKKGVTGHMPFSLPVAIDTMLQVAQAMRVLHEKKLTHRDLKTSNILVKPVNEGYLELHSEGYLEVKLADFGSAKEYANTSQTGDLTRNTGTTVYGAPEIFEKEKILREKNFPPKADVWSFGMTCSEILTGEVPFAAESRPTLHRRIVKNGLRPNLPEDCPEYLQFCISSCWELQPQKRPNFLDLCWMLRHAKLLILGLMDVVDSKCLFAYRTSAGVLKSSVHSLHLPEEAKTSRYIR